MFAAWHVSDGREACRSAIWKDPCGLDFPGNCARMLPRDLLRGGQCLSIVARCDYVDTACRGFLLPCLPGICALVSRHVCSHLAAHR